MEVYQLVSCFVTMENHHAINGKTHYFDSAIFNSYVTNYQRVVGTENRHDKIVGF